MAKDDDKPKEWTPDQPLPDEDDEAELQRHVQAEKRKQFLLDPKNKKSGARKRGGLFN